MTMVVRWKTKWTLKANASFFSVSNRKNWIKFSGQHLEVQTRLVLNILTKLRVSSDIDFTYFNVLNNLFLSTIDYVISQLDSADRDHVILTIQSIGNNRLGMQFKNSLKTDGSEHFRIQDHNYFWPLKWQNNTFLWHIFTTIFYLHLQSTRNITEIWIWQMKLSFPWKCRGITKN